MKIFSTLFSPAYGIVRAVLALALGVVMVVWPGTAIETVIRVIGAVLVVIGGVSLALSYTEREDGHTNIMSFNGIFDVVFGLLLIIFPAFFAGLSMYLFGAVMLVFGIGQIVNLLAVRKKVEIGAVWFVLPFVVAVCGVVVLFMRQWQGQPILYLVFGIALIVYAFTEVVISFKTRQAKKAELKAAKEKEKPAGQPAEKPAGQPVGKPAEDSATPAEAPAEVTEEKPE